MDLLVGMVAAAWNGIPSFTARPLDANLNQIWHHLKELTQDSLHLAISGGQNKRPALPALYQEQT